MKYLCFARVNRYNEKEELADGFQWSDAITVLKAGEGLPISPHDYRLMMVVRRGEADWVTTESNRLFRRDRGKTELTEEQWKSAIKDEMTEPGSPAYYKDNPSNDDDGFTFRHFVLAPAPSK